LFLTYSKSVSLRSGWCVQNQLNLWRKRETVTYDGKWNNILHLEQQMHTGRTIKSYRVPKEQQLRKWWVSTFTFFSLAKQTGQVDFSGASSGGSDYFICCNYFLEFHVGVPADNHQKNGWAMTLISSMCKVSIKSPHGWLCQQVSCWYKGSLKNMN
jgi:hypothetical protein